MSALPDLNKIINTLRCVPSAAEDQIADYDHMPNLLSSSESASSPSIASPTDALHKIEMKHLFQKREATRRATSLRQLFDCASSAIQTVPSAVVTTNEESTAPGLVYHYHVRQAQESLFTSFATTFSTCPSEENDRVTLTGPPRVGRHRAELYIPAGTIPEHQASMGQRVLTPPSSTLHRW